MNKKTIRDIDVTGKKVLVRCDFNVPLDGQTGEITDNRRIRAAIPTIKYLIDNNAKVILCSHLGRPKGEFNPKYSLKPVAEELSKLLGKEVKLAKDVIGEDAKKLTAEIKEGEVVLLENVRFHKEEEQNDPEFAKKLASCADIYVNDAFGTAHRAHASTAGVADYLPAVSGFLIEKEIKGLEPVINPIHPFVIIMGGAKVNDKLDIIKGLLPKCDYLLVGGGIANSFLACYSNVGKSLIDEDKIEDLKVLLSEYKEKIIIPTDVIVDENENIKNLRIDNLTNDSTIYDIGSETINNYAKYINDAKTIFLNGTMGLYEDDKYSSGTKEILNLVSISFLKQNRNEILNI